jgi:hypothetical protein
MIISTCNNSFTELQLGSVKTIRPALPRQKIAPTTLQLSTASDHGQKGITSPGRDEHNQSLDESQQTDNPDEPPTRWAKAKLIRCWHSGDAPVGQPRSKYQKRRREIQRCPDPERRMMMAESLPMHDGRHAEQAGE